MTSIRTLNQTLLALLAAGVMAGCSSTKLDEAPVETRTPVAVAPNSGATAGGTGQSRVTPVDIEAQNRAMLMGLPRVVYFDYDSFVVKDEFRGAIEANAKALAGDRARRVSVEGHTDSRGGSEYNLALGQKRAEAVAKSLTLLGATEAQVEAVSFGKERPADNGENEAAWAKNRRAELNYR